MAALETPRVTPGWKAVDFHLKGTDAKFYTLADVRGPRPTRDITLGNRSGSLTH